MVLPAEKWHYWDRIKLRMIPISKYDSFFRRPKDIFFRYLSSTTEIFMERLILLTWIGELRLAEKLWEEEKDRHPVYEFPTTFEEFLFRVLICERDLGRIYFHPEFHGVTYLLLEKEDAFKLSTILLSELLEMDEPYFSSVDGLITVDFDKHELGRISKIVPEKYQKELRLPLILLKKYWGCEDPYTFIGTKLENMLLQKILKLTDASFEKYAEVEEKIEIAGITMLRRRRFNTIYKILPETSKIWLSTMYQRPQL